MADWPEKGKTMKTVFRNHSEVCRVWAKQNQHAGRAGNISFDWDTIYSYGWWPMAKFIESDIVLYRDMSYSPSTGQHQSHVRSVISHCRVFDVISLTPNHEDNIKHYLAKIRKTADGFWNARAGYVKWHNTDYFALAMQTRNYAKHFNCENLLPPLFGLELSGWLAKHHLIICKARQEKIDKRNQEKLARWQGQFNN